MTDYWTERLKAYAFFQGQVRGVLQLLDGRLLDLADAVTMLRAAEARLTELQQAEADALVQRSA